MKSVYCPKCGKMHKSVNKQCDFCGENLEFVILRFKQDHLPIKYQKTAPPYDEEKAKKIEKDISEYIRAEEKLDEYDILPENLTRQTIASSYTKATQIQTSGRLHGDSQKIKLQRKRESLWFEICFGCC